MRAQERRNWGCLGEDMGTGEPVACRCRPGCLMAPSLMGEAGWVQCHKELSLWHVCSGVSVCVCGERGLLQRLGATQRPQLMWETLGVGRDGPCDSGYRAEAGGEEAAGSLQSPGRGDHISVGSGLTRHLSFGSETLSAFP